MHPVTPTVYKFTTIYYNGRRPRETIHPLLPSTERGKEREREREGLNENFETIPSVADGGFNDPRRNEGKRDWRAVEESRARL